MKDREPRGRTVVWAVDPFETELQPPLVEVRNLADTVHRAGLELLPVYVISAIDRQWETGELPHVPEIQETFDRYLDAYDLGDIRPRLVFDVTGTQGGAVKALLELAEEADAAWITVSTHGRQGMERLVLGSFAETLVEQSRCPILFLPHRPSRPALRASRTALFPTDLSEASRSAFSKFLSVAARQELDIVIFHALSYPIPSVDFGLGAVDAGPGLPENFMEEQRDVAQLAGAHLVEEARSRGVMARFSVHSAMMPSISGRAVLEAARRENARIIAMPTMTGPLTRFVAGSVAQEVFRAGRTLTWLYGPRALEKSDANAA